VSSIGRNLLGLFARHVQIRRVWEHNLLCLSNDGHTGLLEARDMYEPSTAEPRIVEIHHSSRFVVMAPVVSRDADHRMILY
jgi:hypothetical protein